MIHEDTRSDTKEAFLSETSCAFVDHLKPGFAFADGFLRCPEEKRNRQDEE